MIRFGDRVTFPPAPLRVWHLWLRVKYRGGCIGRIAVKFAARIQCLQKLNPNDPGDPFDFSSSAAVGSNEQPLSVEPCRWQLSTFLNNNGIVLGYEPFLCKVDNWAQLSLNCVYRSGCPCLRCLISSSFHLKCSTVCILRFGFFLQHVPDGLLLPNAKYHKSLWAWCSTSNHFFFLSSSLTSD